MGALLTFVVVLTVVLITVVFGIRNKKRNSQQKKHTGDPYNGFHLGEMTKHDIPKKLNKQEENKRWASRQTKEAENLNQLKEGDKKWNRR